MLFHILVAQQHVALATSQSVVGTGVCGQRPLGREVLPLHTVGQFQMSLQVGNFLEELQAILTQQAIVNLETKRAKGITIKRNFS